MDDSLSIDAQVRACADYIARQGWTHAGTYADPDTRGWTTSRPAFDQMLARFRDGAADTVVVFKLSRFMRSLMDQERLIAEIADAGGELVSVMEPWISTSPMVRQILGAVNEQYKRDQADFLKAAWAGRARRGLHHGGAPYGYRMVDGRLARDEPAASVVREVFRWARSGHGSPEIAYRLNQAHTPTPRGGQQWTEDAVLRMLRRPVYCGRVVLNGELVTEDGEHEALVEPALYDAVQATLDRRRGVRRKASPSWLDGFVWHGCGTRMYVAKWYATAGQPVRWRFRCGRAAPNRNGPARCTVSPRTIMADKAEAAMRDLLPAALATIAPPDAVTRALESRHADAADERQRQRRRLARRLDDIARQRDRLLDMHLQERVDPDVYATRDGALKDEQATIRAQLAAVPPPVDATQVEARYHELTRLRTAVLAVIHHAPAELPELLHALDVRLIIDGDGHRLAFGDDTDPYLTCG